ncbi:MAG: cobalt-precorrin 5A hydrolase [Eubacterium sp.]|jgi:cobalt-precorrin 5A hydrolase|nr:cobalt-precorrin 5A hydrolase [Eubacterium sp.]
MKIAVIVFTKKGADLANRILEKLDCDLYIFYKYHNCLNETQSFIDSKYLTAELFIKYESIVFIGACGLAVRLIAPNIKDKRSDPAVIVISEEGKYVVPILSGHLGGGNSLAKKIADITGGIPIITTATDIRGVFAVDLFAKKNDLIITDMHAAKEISAAFLNNEPVGFKCGYESDGVPDIFSEDADIGICIFHSPEPPPFLKTLFLLPKNIVLGIGCRKNTSSSSIEKAVNNVMGKIGFNRIKNICTHELKREEKGLTEFAEKYGIKIEFYSSAKLSSAVGEFSSSEFVERVIGIDNVCERSAVLGCGGSGGDMLIPKTVFNGVSVSVYEKKIRIGF